MPPPVPTNASQPTAINNTGDGPQNILAGSGFQTSYSTSGVQFINSTLRFESPSAQPRGVTEAQEKKDCLNSLSFHQLGDRHDEITDPHKQTCDWLFHTQEFQSWRNRIDLSSFNGVLWIKGKPGVGKSTLMKHTLRYCKDVLEDHLVLDYFFNARGQKFEKTRLGMLRSLLYQIVNQDIIPYRIFRQAFLRKLDIHKGWNWQWGELEIESYMLSGLLSELKTHQSKPLIFLIDALDECQSSDMRAVVKFLELLSIKAVDFDVAVAICLSSRYFPNVTIRKALILMVDESKDHEEDIARYVRAELRERIQNIQYIPDESIGERIQERASGVFMWVVLVVALLNKAHDEGDEKAIKKTFDTVPESLEEVFSTLLHTDDNNRAETVLMVQWVLLGQRHLKPEELFFASKMDEASNPILSWDQAIITDELIKNRIVTSSKGLIQIRKDGTAQFIHQTVNDFFYRGNRLQELDQTLAIDPIGESHARLWNRCRLHLEQLTTIPMESMKALGDRYPFLGYSMNHIFGHAEEAASRGVEIVAIAKWLRGRSDWFGWWKAFLGTTTSNRKHAYLRHHQSPDFLYVLSLEGYQALVEILLDQETIDPNAQGAEFGNALQAALAKGRENIVRMLLAKKVNINAIGGIYGTALQAAIITQRNEMLALLLEYKADVNAQGGLCGTPLQAAATIGAESAIQILLDHGALINAHGGFFGSALQASTMLRHDKEGQGKLVELLLECGANVNSRGGIFGSALQTAAWSQNKEAIEILYHHGADVNAQGGVLGSALQIAFIAGEEMRDEIIQLLLNYGADVNAKGGVYGSALQIAAATASSLDGEGEEENFVQLLLDQGADVNAQGGLYGSALQAAAYHGNQQMVQLLLNHEADVNAHSSVFSSALHAAALAPDENEGIVQLLLDHGADVKARGGLYGSALQTAVVEGHKNIARLLLDSGAEIDVQEGVYVAALLDDLLEGECNASSEESDTDESSQQSSADSAQAISKKLEVFKMLFEKAKADNAEDNFGYSALYQAVVLREHAIVRFLLNTGFKIFDQRFSHNSLLDTALWPYDLYMARTLLENGTDVGVDGGIPLSVPSLVFFYADKGNRENREDWEDWEDEDNEGRILLNILLEKGCWFQNASEDKPSYTVFRDLAASPLIIGLVAVIGLCGLRFLRRTTKL